MRLEISAKDLPNHIGKTIYLHDEETKKDEVVKDIRVYAGWIRGYNTTQTSIIDISLNYRLTKIFVDA